MTDPYRTRRRFLHGERPNGAHAWLPFSDDAELRAHIERFAPACPPDTTWSISARDVPPPEPEEAP